MLRKNIMDLLRNVLCCDDCLLRQHKAIILHVPVSMNESCFITN